MEEVKLPLLTEDTITCMETAEETHYNTSRARKGFTVLQRTTQTWAWGNTLVTLALRSLRHLDGE